MFTAKDMHNKLKSRNVCNGLDEWIEDILYKKFIQYGNAAVVMVSDIGSRGWVREGFVNEMNSRGFCVEYISDQRDGDYYRVSYPPQER
jgi:hypothetical protein